jgi:hypothetical protein
MLVSKIDIQIARLKDVKDNSIPSLNANLKEAYIDYLK